MDNESFELNVLGFRFLFLFFRRNSIVVFFFPESVAKGSYLEFGGWTLVRVALLVLSRCRRCRVANLGLLGAAI